MAAAKKSVKVKDTEDLSDSNIEKVIELLSAEKPCTKKEACSILRIAYNTTRLQTIIDNFLEKKARAAKLRAEKSHTPATPGEIEYSIKEYLSGAAVSVIAESLYRSASFVTRILDQCSVPRRATGWSYQTPQLIPEEAIRTSFNIGEKVWSARYESLATIKSEVTNQPHPSKVYRVYLEDESWQQSAYQPAEELASLEHLTKYGVSI
jgi:hypothetical protein